MTEQRKRLDYVFERHQIAPRPVLLHYVFRGDENRFKNAMKAIRRETDTIILSGGVAAYRLKRSVARSRGTNQGKKIPPAKYINAAVGLACHCLLRERPLFLATRSELRDHLPSIFDDDSRTQQFVFETDKNRNPTRLSHVVVDAGAAPHTILRRARDVVSRGIERLPAFRRLAVVEHQFSIDVLTTTPTRQQSIEREFESDKYEMWEHVPVNVRPNPHYASLFLPEPKEK